MNDELEKLKKSLSYLNFKIRDNMDFFEMKIRETKKLKEQQVKLIAEILELEEQENNNYYE